MVLASIVVKWVIVRMTALMVERGQAKQTMARTSVGRREEGIETVSQVHA